MSDHWVGGEGVHSLLYGGVNRVSGSRTFRAQSNLLLPFIFGGGGRA